MKLQFEDVKKIIIENPGKDALSKARDYSKKLQLHLHGINTLEQLAKYEGLENDVLHKLRIKYFRDNKAIMSRLTRPIDKVFTAKGGSVYMNLTTTEDQKARQIITDLEGGVSLRKFIETKWLPHYLDDPNGVILIERYTKDQLDERRKQGKSTCYPVYVSCKAIYDYKLTGNRIEYLVMELSKQDITQYGISAVDGSRYFRVIDDEADMICEYKADGSSGPTVYELPALRIDNLFGYVPAITCADATDESGDGLNTRLSFLDAVVGIANEYLQENSIHRTHRLMHGFPKYWEYADTCQKCKGTGRVNGNTCSDCAGSGKSVMTRVSDVKILRHPGSREDAIIAPNVAGYVSPDKVYHEIATASKQLMEQEMFETIWGVAPAPKVQGPKGDGKVQTATEIMSDLKPQADRLQTVSESAERRHKFILDAIITCDVKKNYEGSSVNYGKRFLLESPEQLWDNYQLARQRGASLTVLDDLLNDFLEAKYQSDPVKLTVQQKLTKVEPFVHNTIAEVKGFGVDDETMKAKLFFSEWLSSVTSDKLLTQTAPQLLELLKNFVSTKQLAPPEPQPIKK